MTRRILLDTGPAFDALFQRRDVHHRIAAHRGRGTKVGIGLPGLAEIAAGLEISSSRAESWETARRGLSKFVHWPFDKAAALDYGLIQAELRRKGRPMQQIEVMLAAIARTLGSCVLVTYDSDLSAVPNLTVENWSLLLPPPSAP